MHDIRELLELGKGEAPPPSYGADELIAAAGHRRRRQLLVQRIGGAGVVAVGLATLVLLVANSVLLSGNRSVTEPIPDPTSAGQPAAPVIDVPPLTFIFDEYSVGAYRVLRPVVATTTYQEASIVTDFEYPDGQVANAFVGYLTVYRPGVTPPERFLSGTSVMVNGLPGFAEEREQDSTLAINGSSNYPQPHSGILANTLAWQYAADSWAVINSVVEVGQLHLRLTEADTRALAEAFTLGTPSPARIPFQAGYLPAGFQVVSVQGDFSNEDYGMITVIFAPASAAGTDKIRHFTNDGIDGPAVVINVVNAGQLPPDAPELSSPHCGTLFTDADITCSWDIGGGYGVVIRDPASTLTEAEIIQIGASLTFDDLDQPDTWHPVA
jgi:hypothetical protein